MKGQGALEIQRPFTSRQSFIPPQNFTLFSIYKILKAFRALPAHLLFQLYKNKLFFLDSEHP